MNPGNNLEFSFEYNKLNTTRARIGILVTPHGAIETPSFIFCGTKGSIKGVHIKDVVKENSQIILANTYHLMLQPGQDIVYKNGGLHKFMGWQGPIMTDSGGFQIFSLGHGSVASEIKGMNTRRGNSLVNINKNGAEFKSYLNGQKYLLTPEKSMEIQEKLGADLCFAFDECTPFHVTKEYTENSMNISHEWEKRSLDHFKLLQLMRSEERNIGSNLVNDLLPQCLYGIAQGGIYSDLREKSVDFISNLDFFGNAIGGSLGGNVNQMYEIVEKVSALMHKNTPKKPIHLLGIGKIRDIFHGVLCGIDTFDCVHPTRIARHGGAIVKSKVHYKLNEDHQKNREHINLLNSSFKEDINPIDPDCTCQTCQTYSRSYIHHLLKSKEMLGYVALTIHNINSMNRLMSDIRDCFKYCIQNSLNVEVEIKKLMSDWVVV